MNPIRALRYLIGLGVVIYLIGSGIWKGATAPDNGQAEKNIRHAADIVHMWINGVTPALRPNLKPPQARQLLQEALATQAEAKVKNEARKLLAELDSRPHYFAFTERIDEFLPHVAEYLNLTGPDGASEALGKPPVGKFVVLQKRKDERVPQENAKPDPYFDAEMIEACGDRVALTPAEVAVVVTFETEREVVGTYYAKGMIIGGKQIDFNDPKNRRKGQRNAPESYAIGSAYREMSVVTVREYPSGRLINLKLLTAVDPPERTSGRGASESPSAAEQMRVKLADYLKDLAAGKVGSAD